MSKRIVTAVAILGAAGVISGCNIEQPSAGCIVQDATDVPWQAAYTLKNPADASKSCGNLKGEAIGVFKFVNPYPNLHPDVPVSRLAIRPAGAAALTVYNEGDEPVVRVDDLESATSMSTGLADQPDAQGLCAASGFTPATVAARAVTSSTGEVLAPAQTVTYSFSDVKVYSAPSAPGTQLSGTLTYSDGTGCSAEYQVLALWPQVPCDPTSTKPEESCGVGSGLNPDFDAVCVADIGPDGAGGCVPRNQVPAFKK